MGTKENNSLQKLSKIGQRNVKLFVVLLILSSILYLMEYTKQREVDKIKEEYDLKIESLKFREEELNREIQEEKEERERLNLEFEKLKEEKQNLKEKQEKAEQENTRLKKEVETQRKKLQSATRSKPLGDGNFQTFKATAYTTYANGDKLAGKQWGDKTAIGTTCVQGRTIAVDKNVIPLKSKVEIIFPEPFTYMNGIYTAEDTGSAIKGNKIDVYFDSLKVCNNFGRRDLKARIVK